MIPPNANIRGPFLQAVFELQRPGRGASLDAIVARLGLKPEERRRAVYCASRLMKRGWIAQRTREGDGTVETGCYQLTPAGAEALASGKAHREEARRPAGVPRGSVFKQRLWTALRAFGKFDVGDVVAVLIDAGAPAREVTRVRRQVTDFLRGLERAGYLVALRSGGNRRKPRYLLVRNTGPRAPIVRWRRFDVADPNNNQVHAFDAHLQNKEAA